LLDSIKINKKIMEPKYKTGLQRFYEKYPYYPRSEKREDEYLGIGAMMIPVGLVAEIDSQKSHNR